MKKIIGAFVLLMTVIVVSCNYPLDKKYVNPISPPPAQINVFVDISAPGFTSTPYYLDWTTTFSLKIENTNRPIRYYSVEMDSKVIDSKLSNNEITFTLSPYQAGDGTHTVKLKVSIATESGSLADLEGLENYEVEKDFDVIVSSSLPQFSQPVTSIENGYLKIEWNQSPDRKFRYSVSKFHGFDYNQTFIEQNTFMGSGHYIYYDSGYVGGPTQYTINVSNFAANATMPYVKMNKGTQFSLQPDLHKLYKLSWTPLFADAILTVVGPGGSRLIDYNTGAVDLDTLFLGDTRNYHLLVNRNLHPAQRFDSTFSIVSASNLPPFKDIKVFAAQSKFIIYGPLVYNPSSGQYDIRKFTLPDFTVEDNLTAHFPGGSYNPILMFAASADGQRLTYSMGGVPVKLDPLTFSSQSGYFCEIPMLDGAYSLLSPSAMSSYANNGLLAMSYINNGASIAAIADMTINADPVATYSGIVWKDSINTDIPVLSDDGQFFVVNASDRSAGQVYMNVSGSWTQIGKVPAGKYFFRNHGTSELIAVTNTIQVFDVSTPVGNGFFAPDRSFNYQNTTGNQTVGDVGYDDATQNIFVETITPDYHSTIRTYDVSGFLNNGKMTANVAPGVFPVKHIYSDNYHFITSGYGEKVQ